MFHGRKEGNVKPKNFIHGFYICRDNLQDGFYTFFVMWPLPKSAVSLETKFHAIQDMEDKKDSYSLVMQHSGSGVKHDLFDMTGKLQKQ